jgi:hypothetical protein
MRIAVLALLAGCGGGNSHGKDWSDKPLDKPTTGKVDKVGFTIELPTGMVPDPARKGDLSKEYRADLDDSFSEPSVTVGYEAIPAKSLEDFVQEKIGHEKKKRVIVTRKTTPAGGFVLSWHTENNGWLGADAMVVKGDAHLECSAHQATEGGVPNPEKTLAWLESICASLTIQ